VSAYALVTFGRAAPLFAAISRVRAASSPDGVIMSELPEASSASPDGYLTEDEVAAQRRKAKRTLRDERRRRAGPPFVKDGHRIFYPLEGFRTWLKSMERQPVRGPVKVA
jgi:hypothetical protein